MNVCYKLECLSLVSLSSLVLRLSVMPGAYLRAPFLASMIKQVALNKSSLLLKYILQNTQTLELLTINIKTEIIHQTLLKMPSWKAWVERSKDLLKEG
jgi:hypothetical protein